MFRYFTASRKGNFSGIERLIRNALAEQYHQAKSVLSLGCGIGKDLKTAMDLYPTCTTIGIDTSRTALMKAKNEVTRGNFICSCISHLPFRHEVEFDAIIVGHLLEFLSENSLNEVMTEVSHHTSKASRFYITFWKRIDDRCGLDHMFLRIGHNLMKFGWKIMHIQTYSHREISPLSEGGFIIAEKD
jgi:SAM-dependent methyltransferase